MSARSSLKKKKGESKAKARARANAIAERKTLLYMERELKGFDVRLVTNTGPHFPDRNVDGDNSGFILLNPVACGTGFFNRVGKRIHMVELEVDAVVLHDMRNIYDPEVDPQASLDGSFIRICVVYDYRPGETFPDWNEVFQSTVNYGTYFSSITSRPSFVNTGRFSILYDEITPTNPTIYPETSAGTGDRRTTNFYRVKFIIPLDDFETIFRADNSEPAVADITTGGLYMIVRSYYNDEDINRTYFAGDSFARLRWKDK